MVPEIATSHFTIVVAIGASAYIGILHLLFWSWGRGATAHLWTGLFCLAAVGFQAARYVQIHTPEPASAVAAARFQAATASFLVCFLVAFTRTLRDSAHRIDRSTLGCLFAATAASALCLATPWVVPEYTEIRADWTGRSFLSVPMNPAMAALLAPPVLAGLGYFLREIVHTERVHDAERRVLLICLGLWGIFALGSLLWASSSDNRHIPVVSQFSPLVLAIGLNYVLLHRDRRMASQLEETVGTRTRELGDSEARYRALVDNSPLGVIACDREGWMIAANPGVLKTLGVRKTPGRALNLFDHPVAIELGLETALRGCIETGQPWTSEVTYGVKAGRRLELRIKIAAIRDSRGRITGVQIITEDIEDEKQLEERLRQSQKMEAVGRLAAGIAHEINNPMAYVRSNLSLLQREYSDMMLHPDDVPSALRETLAECAELIEESMDGVERTISIVREVKEFSHTSGDGRVEADLNEVLDDALRIATPRLSPSVTVERMYSELPALLCSPGQLQQVFLNLIVNATQAVGPSGTIWLITRCRDDEILVRVEDDGCGMETGTLEHLFDPFFTTKGAGEGTGLGLYISYEIVEMHGGDIQAMSAPGEGSAFEIRLPLEHALPDEGAAEDDAEGR